MKKQTNDPRMLPLTSDDIARMTHRARAAGQPSWTGTSGALAADVMRLLWERERLLVELLAKDLPKEE